MEMGKEGGRPFFYFDFQWRRAASDCAQSTAPAYECAIRLCCLAVPASCLQHTHRVHPLHRRRSQDAKSDLVNVLSSLEAHWHVLEAEVVEINRDIDYCEQCLRKYGEWFNSPLQYLRELKRTKKNKMCASRSCCSWLSPSLRALSALSAVSLRDCKKCLTRSRHGV